MKNYIEVNANDKHVTHLKCEVYYKLGGMNYFTYKNEPRGYYASVTPVERTSTLESFVAFSGLKQLLKEVSRKSTKAEKTAEEMAERIFPVLIDHVCKKEGLTIALKAVETEKKEEVA